MLIPCSFARALRSALETTYHTALLSSTMHAELRSSALRMDGGVSQKLAKTLADEHFSKTYPEAAITAGHEEYETVHQQQSALMLGGFYIELGGSCLRKLSNLQAAIICGGDGSIPANLFSDDRNECPELRGWMHEQCPSLKLKTSHFLRYADKSDGESDTFTELVFRLLTIAQTPLTSLVSSSSSQHEEQLVVWTNTGLVDHDTGLLYIKYLQGRYATLRPDWNALEQTAYAASHTQLPKAWRMGQCNMVKCHHPITGSKLCDP